MFDKSSFAEDFVDAIYLGYKRVSQLVEAFFIVSDPLLALRVKFVISSMGLLVFIAKRVHIFA